MALVHLFNPGHEAAIAVRSPFYTPPVNIARMADDLALLPLWYGSPGDFVITSNPDVDSFYSALPSELLPLPKPVRVEEMDVVLGLQEGLKAAPWGLSPHSCWEFERMNHRYNLSLCVPAPSPLLLALSSREQSALVLNEIREQYSAMTIPRTPLFCSSAGETAEAFKAIGATAVVKMVHSSSGRGLLWVTAGLPTPKDMIWIEGAIKRQGKVSVEPMLQKVNDYSVQFYMDEAGRVSFLGVSSFITTRLGHYAGTMLAPQRVHCEALSKLIPQGDMGGFVHTLCLAIEKHYKGYVGFLGMDMMSYLDNDGRLLLHPCVEVNLRRTFGQLALALHQRFLAPSTHGFLYVAYHKSKGEALAKHRSYTSLYPLTFENRQITKGYLSLTPVGIQTQYMAYLLIE